MIVSFDFDYCYLQVDPETGFAVIRDLWDNLEIYTLDSVKEALEFLNSID